MKFVTFQITTPIGPVERTGLLRDEMVIDLNAACAVYLREAKSVRRWNELAHALVPTNMIKFIENGPLAMEALHLSVEYIDKMGNPAKSEKGEGFSTSKKKSDSWPLYPVLFRCVIVRRLSSIL